MSARFFDTDLYFAGYNINNEVVNNSFRQCIGEECDSQLCEIVNMENVEYLYLRTVSLCKSSEFTPIKLDIITILMSIFIFISIILNIFLIIKYRRNIKLNKDYIKDNLINKL